MSIFGNATWDYLDTPDITCSNDESSISLNRWEVSLGIFILFSILLGINGYFGFKADKQARLNGKLDERYGKIDLLDMESSSKTRSRLERDILGGVSMTRRKDSYIHYYSLCAAMGSFSLILILFQRFPQSIYGPMVFIIPISFYVGVVVYFITTIPADPNPIEKVFRMYSPGNVYQDLSVPLIHPLLVFFDPGRTGNHLHLGGLRRKVSSMCQ